ncbi:leucine dehydrogenase [Anaerobranca californiensis DSM 14826]|jgi:leucine dehydrogenase|uniref:Leucine dehydrogenase n=1 Tax=Anaerobranca californiensis DSM 14826 TaxID=1120989 RepID=A0A1M6L592_9FIRM|nr:Glu/Leu/Phe/Val dehydrogenase dimerization domain-containing protein [Anaerobranca californiensis]SHJ66371.1 leucine dehydrogenase [Anaerobranca californiensis DSM 14826]
MKIFEMMEKEGHEQLIFNQDKASGLKALIAIHDTTLGPALGGCRMWPYKTEEEAIYDVLRLSKGMTYKSAASGQDYGGGKSVIWGDPKKDKSEAMFRAFGRFIDGFKGRFSTGTDVGTTYHDFIICRKETPYIGALPESYGGGGNSSIITAFGTWKGIKAVAKEAFGSDSLEGKVIAVQGLGKVGYYLVGYLIEDGAKVIGTDIVQEHIDKVLADYPGVTIVKPEEIYEVECDIFSPNALGAIINDETIPKLKCKAIAGAANNQLAEPRHGDKLHELGIVYGPDYVVNAGGLIQVADELEPGGYNKERAYGKAAGIYDMLLKIFEISRRDNIPTYKAADTLVHERLETYRKVKTIYKK